MSNIHDTLQGIRCDLDHGDVDDATRGLGTIESLLDLLDETEPRRFVPKPERFRQSLAGLLRNLRAGLEEITDLIKLGDIERLQEFCEDGQLGDGELAILDRMADHLSELKTEADKGPDEGQYSALDFCDLYCVEATP